jgi:type IV pilus assembly protein PilY1
MNMLLVAPKRRIFSAQILNAICSSTLAMTLALVSLLSAPARAATALADQPIFATRDVAGNLALLLSVEFPTVISAAYTDRVYKPANEYLGYFDPKKCYTYRYTDGTGVDNYFEPSSMTADHTCSGKWSGNFLNWSSMQTVDPFRGALTGGYRVIDEVSRTVVEKAWSDATYGSFANFPDGSLTGTDLAGATPFSGYGSMTMRTFGMANKLRFALSSGPSGGLPLKGNYYNNKNLSGGAVLTRTDVGTAFINGNSPGPGVNQYNYSVRFTGSIKAPVTGKYNFQTISDDGVRLYVNGAVVINNFTDHAPTTDTGLTNSISQGSNIDIVLEYYQNGGGAVLDLKWKPPGASGYSAIGGSADLATTPSHYTNSNAAAGGTLEVFVRAKICDKALGVNNLETNCVKYGSNYKPEGLIQQYANKIRYSAFGYLNDDDILRDGGVLRAQQKFVGPMKPVPNLPAITNPAAEWDADTGIFKLNPDAADAANTKAVMGLPDGAEITNSGVANYVNKFGELKPTKYKLYDPVSELYYGALRYFKNLAPIPEWTAVPAGTSNATKIEWTDGFPVIVNPIDPITETCQRNFILGIGDTNSNADKNVPGAASSLRSEEPAIPALVAADKSLDALTATNALGVLEGLGASLGTANPYGGCCHHNSALIAGLAYEAHVKDIRGRTLEEPQTVETYWVDVQEYLKYKADNMYYLTAKYGGFTVPKNYSMSNTTPLNEKSWHTTADTFTDSTDATKVNKRPDNYFSGGRPDLMKAGLNTAFADIAGKVSAFTTSFSTALPQVAAVGNSSYSSQYDPGTWTGEVTASTLSFDATAATTTVVDNWTFSARLAEQLKAGFGAANRRVVTWGGVSGTGVEFLVSGGSSQIPAADFAAGGALDPSYISGNDASNYVDYLRGDQSREISLTDSDSKRIYRTRTKLVGDIVDSRVTPNGPPSFPFSDATNPGYSAFKTTWANRLTTVFVGANDGMLHAIDGAPGATSSGTPPSEASATYGQELFAYIPRALFNGPTAPNIDGLAALGNSDFTHHYMVNATPNVSDVDFARVPKDDKTRPAPDADTSDWRSVLIGGLGKGGKAYYAIDVTDPVSMGKSQVTAASKVLWEFSNSTKDMSGELGYTYGDPLIMKTKKYGWVVMFTSGYNNADGKGYFIFVNPKTGALLEMVPTGEGSTTNDAGLAQAEAFIVDVTDGTADAVYAGDLLGNMWRLDVTSTSGKYSDAGKLVRLARLTDKVASAQPQPVTARPAVEVHPKTKVRFVMFGTGRLLDKTDIGSKQGQTFYSIADGTNAAFNATPFPPAATPAFPLVRSQLTENTDVTDQISFDPSAKAGWFEELGFDQGTPANAATGAAAVPSTGYAWRLISAPTTASGQVAFAPTLPSGDACNPSGSSRVYARNFANGQSTLAGYGNYVSFANTVTNLLFVSVDGKLRLVAGTKKGGAPDIVATLPNAGSSLRRLNWRELQVVD